MKVISFRKIVSLTSLTSFFFLALTGAVLASVDPKGPLGQVGFEVGDIILEINGQTIDDVESLARFLGRIQPGQRIALLALDHRTGNTGYVQVVIR